MQSLSLVKSEEIPEANFSVYYASLFKTGADFYDVVTLGDNAFGYFVADISGHKLSCNFLVPSLKVIIRNYCNAECTGLESMKMINHALRQLLPETHYLTACYVTVNRHKHQMTIVNAGHPPVLYLPEKGQAVLIEMYGDVIGSFMDVHFGYRQMKIAQGDRIFLYSDGLVERIKEKSIWPEAVKDLIKFSEQLRKISLCESAKILKHLILPPDYKPEDDIVILAVEV